MELNRYRIIFPITRFRKKILVSLALLLLNSLLVACGDTDQKDNDFDIHIDRAKAYESQGQYRAAEIEWRNAIKKSEDPSASLFQYAQLLSVMGHYRSANEILENWTSEKPGGFDQLRADTYLNLKKYRSTLNVLDEMPSSQDTEVLRAKALMGLGRYKQAEGVLNAVIQQSPQHVGALLIKSRLQVIDGDLESGQKTAEQVLAIEVGNVEANIILADIRSSLGDLELAESGLTEVLAAQPITDIILPPRASILERLSYILTRLGRTNEAYIYTKLLSDAFPGAYEVSEAYEDAFKLFRDGESDKAKEKVSSILESYPRHGPSRHLLGVIEYLQGNIEASLETLSGSVDPEVANPLTTHVYAIASMKLENPQKVIEILEPVIEDTKIPETIALYGNALLSQGRVEEAEQAFLKVLSIDPGKYRVHLALAAIYSSGSKKSEQKEKQHIDLAYQGAPEDSEILVAAVRTKVKYDGKEAADKFLEQAVKNQPNSFNVRRITGYFKASNGQFNEAFEQFNKSLSLASTDDEKYSALIESARSKVALEELAGAEKLFKRAVETQPDSEVAYAGLYSLMRNGKSDEDAAKELLNFAGEANKVPASKVVVRQAVLRGKVDMARNLVDTVSASLSTEDASLELLSVDVSFAQASKALLEGRFEDARSYIVPVLTTQPDALRTLVFLVELETKTGALEEAKKVLGQLEQSHPDFKAIALFKGDIAVAEDNWAAAAKHYRAIWQTSPTDIAGEKLYLTLARLGQSEAKESHLQAWIKRLPNSLGANVYMAISFQEKGQNDAAAKGYEKVLSIDPNHVTALNNLGWLYFEEGNARSLKLLEQAATLAPENAAVLDSYGWVLVETGELKKGLPYLEKAAALAPGIAEIQAHLDSAKSRL